MRALRWFTLLICVASSPALLAQNFAVLADHLYTMTDGAQGGPGLVLIRDGKIEAVRTGPRQQPPDGYTVLKATFVTPGLIDTDTTAGISGSYNIRADQDQDEVTDPNTADVRSLDSFNPNERLLQVLNQYGVTTVQTAPGPRNPIAGRAGIFKTAATGSGSVTVEQLALRQESSMVFNLGDNPKDAYGKKDKAPVTRMKTAEIIRHALADAKAYEEKWDKWKKEGSDISKQPSRDMKLEALLPVVDGKLPAIFNAYRADDIDTAIRIGNEFHLHYMLASVTEGYLISDTIRRAGVPCLLGPVMQRFESLETANATFENPAILKRAGIPIALMTGLEDYVPKNRILLFEAGIAAANGLGMEQALRAATADAAKILAIDDRVGSLAPGKDADIALFDGDPFEYTSHVLAVLVGGQVSYQRSK
ncbi:MAG: amidohydrolase family protein [Terriglobales bacterium]|jgi:imidazolonepropionase-like amidohydrolase